MRHTLFAVVLTVCACSAQTPQPPATVDEFQYLRFMLLNQAYESALVKLHGLNARESAAIHAAGQTLRLELAQHRRLSQSIVANKRSLIDGDRAALAALNAEREGKIKDHANRLLNAVRPQTAARLRAPGRIVASAVRRK